MKRTISSIAAAALVLGALAPAAFAATSASTYTDVTAGGYGATAINSLTSQGYIHGFSDGTFKPGYVVSRGEFLAYLMNALESTTGVKPVANAQYYADVPPGNWDFNYVGAAQENNWINPYWIGVKPGYNFNENYQASFGDAAAFFVSALEANGTLTKADLNGMSPMAFAQSIGLWDGVNFTQNTLTTFQGGTDTTAQQQVYMDRATAAIVLNNMLAYLQGQLLPAGVTVSVTGGQSIAPGTAEQLTIVAKTASGATYTLPSTAMVTYSVDNANGFFNPNMPGQFVASAAGTYNVTATVDGVTTAALKISAYGAAAGLTLTPATASVAANGQSTDAIAVQVVDANGNAVGN
ncbi:MAG: S-layer homology domain-containing protein, partial [Firmicutes bacterium]|nr:S-layer homology domain-containing protein [Bacillota bacterium]